MKGWYKESHRHYLAAKGIKTAKSKKIRYSINPPKVGRAYPVSSSEVKRKLGKMDASGLTTVEFRNPRDRYQENAYAQYKRGRRALTIFSQPVASVDRTYFVERQELIPRKKLKKAVLNKVIPHEVAHHHILYKARITDPTVEMAEARAETLRHGKDFRNDEVVKKYIGAHVV